MGRHAHLIVERCGVHTTLINGITFGLILHATERNLWQNKLWFVGQVISLCWYHTSQPSRKCVILPAIHQQIRRRTKPSCVITLKVLMRYFEGFSGWCLQYFKTSIRVLITQNDASHATKQWNCSFLILCSVFFVRCWPLTLKGLVQWHLVVRLQIAINWILLVSPSPSKCVGEEKGRVLCLSWAT